MRGGCTQCELSGADCLVDCFVRQRGAQGRNVFSYYRMCPLTIECVLLLTVLSGSVVLKGGFNEYTVSTFKRTHSVVREHIL